MAQGICDICHWRPATHTVTASRSGSISEGSDIVIGYTNGEAVFRKRDSQKTKSVQPKQQAKQR